MMQLMIGADAKNLDRALLIVDHGHTANGAAGGCAKRSAAARCGLPNMPQYTSALHAINFNPAVMVVPHSRRRRDDGIGRYNPLPRPKASVGRALRRTPQTPVLPHNEAFHAAIGVVANDRSAQHTRARSAQ